MEEFVLEPDKTAPPNQPRIRIILIEGERTLCLEYVDRMSVLYLDDRTLAWLAPRLSSLAGSNC